MKKFIFAILVAAVIGSFARDANAQMMTGPGNAAIDWDEVLEHTLREEQEGRELWDKLQAKQIDCPALSEHDFGTLGEYYMGQMTGDSHAAMNAMMMQMHGEEGEEQIHIVMGKRFSGCDTAAAFPPAGGGWMPMMQMMWGAGPSPFGPAPGGGFGWFLTVLVWVFAIIGLVAFIKWLTGRSRGGH